jgi:hypothetical protein
MVASGAGATQPQTETSMMYLSQTAAISIADEIATAAIMPYRYRAQWQSWRDTEKSHPAWNRGQLIRAGVSLAPVPIRH